MLEKINKGIINKANDFFESQNIIINNNNQFNPTNINNNNLSSQNFSIVDIKTLSDLRSYIENNSNFYVLMRTLYQISRIEIVNINELNENDIYFFKTRLSIRFQNAFPYLSIFFNIITPLQYRIKWLKSEEFKINELY